MSGIIFTDHMSFEVGTSHDDAHRVKEMAMSLGSLTLIREYKYPSYTTLGFTADNTINAAIFLASISADQERAAQFRLFWSGEE